MAVVAKPSTKGAKCGFTLAEVLITLFVIGIVSALTIPGLVVKNQEKETVLRAQKTYSVFSNAFELARVEYGDVKDWGWKDNSSESLNIIMNKSSPFLNIIRNDKNGGGVLADGTKAV